RSKGVMLTHGNLTFVAEKVRSIQEVYETDSFLSVLPLSHVYENVLGLILPISRGASVYYMSKPPTPTLLMKALEEVKPTMMLIVPLIIEKIYFSRIRPELTRNFLMRKMYHVWPINHFMNRKAGKMLKKAFGGRLRFLGIGGAPLDVSTERFLRDGAVPYSCGYGLTETASLIFGSKVGKVKFRSVGPPLEGVSYMIRKPNDKAIEGEVVVKGRGVMRGYFKDTEQTRQVLSPDGWFSTGDLAEMKNGNLYIRGRSKNMILGPSGENIYPEEIESVLNTMDGVEESVVYEKRGRIIAKVYINPENLAKKYDAFKQFASFKQEELQGRLDNYATDLKKKLNAHLNRYSQVQDMILMNAPFEKTPTHKIKRFLYQN
ncbi:MAG TPA: AMP-dependent synthetase, partial [Porphyromonadaceae bacterium]|nr:AMP-dependent synthetase [Porphyromonadaceae bacterium]